MAKREGAEAGTMSWVDVQSPDLEAAKKFYGALLGWSFVGGDDAEMGNYTMAQVQGRNVAGLAKQMSNAPPAWSVYFATDDADATARRVTDAGGTVVMTPMDVGEEGRMAVFTDPTGAYFGVWQGRRHKGAGLVDEPGAMAWHEVYSRDGASARDFYAKVFGLEPKKMEGAGMEYWTFHRGPKTVCGAMQMGKDFPKDVPSHWNTYFAVANTDAAVKKVGELGGKVISPAWDTPYGRMALVSDPFGATFCVVQLPAGNP